MTLHQLQAVQILRCTLGEAWSFFSDPRNLSVVTPPSLNLRPITDLPAHMYPGLIIAYRVRPLIHIPVTWVTEITHVSDLHFFVDEQRVGPYRIWHHEHRFEELPVGVKMSDLVTYALPFDPWSRPIHRWIVAPQLKALFAYRHKAIEGLFGRSAEHS